jgi:hypothetical protein
MSLLFSVFTINPSYQDLLLLRWVVCMSFFTSMGFWSWNGLQILIHEWGPILHLHSGLGWNIFKQYVYFNLKFIFGLLHDIITSTNMSMKLKKKQIFPWIHQKFLDKSRARKMIIFSQVILRSRFSIRTLMFSSQNFPTPMLGTLYLLMIPHINLYLMIHVVLYF